MVEKTTTGRHRGVGFAVVVLGACLAAGFVVQSLVSYGIARLGPTWSDVIKPTKWSLVASLDRGSERIAIIGDTHGGVRVFVASIFPKEAVESTPHRTAPSWVSLPPPGHQFPSTTMAFGWPMSAWHGHDTPSAAAGSGVAAPSRWQRRLGLDRHRIRDLQPIPLNTLANSAFYGVIVAGVWLIASTARRRWRSRFRPGTCTHCGYALAGLPAAAPCPECGRER